jgi:DNA-binding XRE family transcriptional regulator
MTNISLSQVLKAQLKDPKFKEHYEKELLINAVSKMIVKLRKSAKLTQSELAKRAGTTQPVIARLESGSGSRVPSLLLLARIANATHATLDIKFHSP